MVAPADPTGNGDAPKQQDRKTLKEEARGMRALGSDLVKKGEKVK
jgi:hypothetical protein